MRNLLVVFLLTGVWHGAAWTFIVWGLYHGAFLLIERFGLSRLLAVAPRFVAHAYALLVVLVGWVLFRAETLPQALDYLAVMANPTAAVVPPISTRVLLDPQTLAAMAAGVVFAVPTLPWLLERLRTPKLPPAHTLEARLDTQGVHVLATPALITGLVLSIAILAGSTLNPFLYFRF